MFFDFSFMGNNNFLTVFYFFFVQTTPMKDILSFKTLTLLHMYMMSIIVPLCKFVPTWTYKFSSKLIIIFQQINQSIRCESKLIIFACKSDIVSTYLSSTATNACVESAHTCFVDWQSGITIWRIENDTCKVFYWFEVII